MKRQVAIALLIAALACAGCGKEKDRIPMIEGLTRDNFPVMDGSTSTDPLVRLAAARLLGYNAEWKQEERVITWNIATDLPQRFVEQRLKCSQTHNAFVNLIDNRADMIFSARTMSADEKAYAAEAGVSLVETPIALDALVFIKHDFNPASLTIQQLQDIYTAKIKNWNEVGGEDLPIVPFVRNKNSGSQELMETLVMTEPIPDGFYEDHLDEFHVIMQMVPMMYEVSKTPGGIGYTIYYFRENMVKDMPVPMFSVNGVYPDRNTIRSREYPLAAEVYLIIRSDMDKSSPAYKIYELMQAEAGRKIISESGYIVPDEAIDNN